MPHPLLLYDGVCGFCNHFVQFVIRHDRKGTFKFASLQSSLAVRILNRHRLTATDLDTVYVALNANVWQLQVAEVDPSERVLSRFAAVQFVLMHLSPPWAGIGRASRLIPRFLGDFIYSLVARHRYRIFGRYDTCPVPDSATRGRFLDL